MNKKFMGVLLAALTVTACAGNGSAGTGTGKPTDPGVIAEAQRIINAASTGLIYSPSDYDQPSQNLIAETTWLGPASAPAVPPNATVDVVVCAPSACGAVGRGAAAAARKLGWTVRVIEANGTPETYNSALDAALADRPHAILTAGVPGALVSAKLEQARQRGIVTVAVADVPGQGNHTYDAFVSLREPLTFQLMAHAVIADSNGTAQAMVVNETTSADLVDSTTQFQRVMSACAGCSSVVVDRQFSDARDPARNGQIITAALRAHPTVRYLVLPFEYGLDSTIAALRAVPNGDKVKILVKDATPAELQALQRGEVWAVPAVSLEWMGHAGINQIVNGLAKQPYLPIDAQGVGVHLYTRENLPPDANADFTRWLDYGDAYARLWQR